MKISWDNHISVTNHKNFLWRFHGIESLLKTESAAIRIDLNLARVDYFTHTTQEPCGSPNRSRWIRGVLASTVPNKTQPLNTTPNLRRESPRSTGDITKPLYIAPLPTYLGPCIKDQFWKVFGSSFPLFRICDSTISCSKPPSSTDGP